MNVTSATDSFNFSVMQSSGSIPQNTVAQGNSDPDGDNDRSAGRVRGGFANLVSSIFQALGQTVGGSDTQPAAGSSSSANNTNGTTDGASSATQNQNILQTMQTFMHSLFAALGQNTGNKQDARSDTTPTTNGTNPNANVAEASHAGHHHHHGGAGGLEAKLQSLLQETTNSSGSAISQGSSTDLNSAFQNLLSALNGNGSGTASGQPTLQAFLQNMIQDVKSGSTSNNVASGNVINTTA